MKKFLKYFLFPVLAVALLFLSFLAYIVHLVNKQDDVFIECLTSEMQKVDYDSKDMESVEVAIVKITVKECYDDYDLYITNFVESSETSEAFEKTLRSSDHASAYYSYLFYKP